ncbi:anhydro-N-acetylmuramic acid kinase [Thermoflavimicrobium dichotomicum]|uniref:Anhydro-N-acetylmuramic acid kinase n=1 Tax=Thermoflavimicrobium dichotomicum TaxID=46223 RepID=A0A1I3RS39_9BACL|nr:anhydro-N-acetylmuramic acid kinase [Thermoflavimicrobium dichotomicum]
MGLMSGTSLDGIDAALVEIQGSGTSTKVKLIEFVTCPFSDTIRKEIQDACSVEFSSVRLITSLNFKLGYLFAEAVKKVCEKARVDPKDLDFIGSHGQTIFHLPFPEGSDEVPSTLQIGEPAVIAYETETCVVSNFRTMDMAAGGQGAPLVPYTDFLLFRSSDGRALQNIGGIGNVTVIPKEAEFEDVFAFDTGPGNMIIDAICQRLFGKPYDEDGQIAARGQVHEPLLAECMSHPYFAEHPPKSTGRELFGEEYVSTLLAKWGFLPSEDLVATVTMFTAQSIVDSYQRFIFPQYEIEEVVVSGGGAYNRTLLKMMASLLPDCKVVTQEDLGYSSAAKEAIAFAILANETLHNQPANVPKATGAKKRVILGNITPAPRG